MLASLIPLEIMFIDQSKPMEFLFANTIMTVMAIYAILGSSYMIFSFIILIMNFALLSDIIEVDFKELDEMWSNKLTTTLMYRRMFLKNICEKYFDMRQ